jgi:hypothetical protein
MSRIDRRNMLKVMAATAAGAAGAALSGSGIQSVIAATPNPGGGRGLLGLQAGGATSAPRVVATTAGTMYTTFQGSDFDAGGSTYTWSVSGGRKFPTNGGFYVRRMELPQGAVLTECKFTFSNPTTTPSCLILSGSADFSAFNVIASGTPGATSATAQNLDLTVPPTTIDNSQLWYELDFESGGATDTAIYGARVGWIHHPGLTLFPDPRRIVDGFLTPFTSGVTYGPFDATKKSGGVTPSGVPAGATAAFCAVQSYTAGALTIFPDLTADPGIANYTATTTGPLNLTYMMVPLSTAGKFKIHSYITGKCFVDVWGFAV